MTASEEIDKLIAGLADWRGERLGQLRNLVNEAAPALTEAWKWDTPVWTGKSNVVSLGAFKEHVKVNFFNGASLDDPHGLFNAGLDSKKSRSIDIREGEGIDKASFQTLVRAAAAGDGGNSKG